MTVIDLVGNQLGQQVIMGLAGWAVTRALGALARRAARRGRLPGRVTATLLRRTCRHCCPVLDPSVRSGVPADDDGHMVGVR